MNIYLRAFRLVQDNLRDPDGLPLSVRLLCEAHRVLRDGLRGAGKQPGNCVALRTGSAAPVRAAPLSCRRRPTGSSMAMVALGAC